MPNSQPEPKPPEEGGENLLDDLRYWLTLQESEVKNHIPPYQCGIIYGQLGLHDEAVKSYQLSLERNSRFFQALYNMGLSYLAQDMPRDAENAYEQALQINNADPEVWANLGAVQELLGKEEKALASYEQAVRLEPGEQEARLRAGHIRFSRGEHLQALEIFRLAVEQAPENPETHNALGLALFHLDRIEEAEQSYRKTLELDEANAQVWNNLGNLMVRKKDEAGAQHAYGRAVKLDPENTDYWFNLGEFYLSTDHRDTEKTLLKVVDLDRQDMDAWELLRRWYGNHPNDKRLTSVLRILLEARPDDTGLLNEGAQVSLRQRDYKTAVEYLRRRRALEPENQETLVDIARVHIREGLLDEALKDIRLVTSTDSRPLDFRVYLAQRLLHSARPADAEQVLLPVVEHRQDVPDIWQFLGEASLASHDNDLALERLEKASSLNRNDRTIWVPLAQRFLDEQQYDKAARCLEHIEELMRYLPGLWPHFFETYHKAGRGAELLGRLKNMLEIKMVHPRHWLRLADLYESIGDNETGAECRQKAPPGATRGRDVGSSLWNWEVPGTTEQWAGFFTDSSDGSLVMQPGPVDDGLTEELPEPAAGDRTQVGSSGTAGAGTGARPGKGPDAPVLLLEGEDLKPEREDDPESWVELAGRLIREQRLEDAERVLKQALRLDSQSFEAWFRLGIAYFALDRFGESASSFSTATRIDPGSAKAWYNLGVSRSEEGRMQQARLAFEKVLNLDEKFAKAWDWMAIMHLKAGETEKARACLLRCVELDPRLASGWYNLGVLYRSLGRMAEANECLSRSAELGGPESAGSLGLLQIGSDRKKKPKP